MTSGRLIDRLEKTTLEEQKVIVRVETGDGRIFYATPVRLNCGRLGEEAVLVCKAE